MTNKYTTCTRVELSGHCEEKWYKYSVHCFTYRIDTYILFELIVGVDTVDLPGLSKESTKGEGESKSEHPQTKLHT